MKRRSLIKYGVLSPLVTLPSFLLAGQKREETKTTNSQTNNNDIMKIQRLAWAGIKIEVGSTTLFIDATSGEKDVKLTVNTKNKYALITHAHGDHFDPTALKTVLDNKSLLVCHKDILSWIDTRDFRIHALNTYEPIILARGNSDIVAIPVPAVDGFGLTQVSWIVDGGGKRIIHCGDTLWHGYWWDIARTYGPFDMAFLPINGARQNAGRFTDTGIPAVLTPEQAIAAATLLQAKVVCPIHYGGADENYFETPDPEGTFIKLGREQNMNIIIPKQGDWLKL